jgi:very-short-patch-repair endonuclease
MKKIIPYDPKLKELAKQLRNNSTLGEVLLWKKLRSKQFGGFDFHRQKPLLHYIVDFYCPSLALVIEIDGGSHKRSDVSKKDFEKQAALENKGLIVVRFTEKEVRFQMNDVLRKLQDYVKCYEEQIC